MRNAPPVAVACDGGVFWLAVQAGLHAVTASVVAAWFSMGWALPMVSVVAAALVAAAAGGWLAWRMADQPPVPLAWDGERWCAGLPAVPGQIDIMIDLGGWLLLRFRPEPAHVPQCWLALSGSAASGALHAFRVALHAGPARPASSLRAAERQPG